MRTSKIILSVGIATTLLLNMKFANANSDSTKIYFQQAFKEVKNMLEGKQPMSFEKAVFVTENAYRDNQFIYANFQKSLDVHTYLIKGLMKGSSKENEIDFRTLIDFSKPNFDINTLNYTEKEKREMYRKTLANWAIFKYMTDTIQFSNIYHRPWVYQISDPFGMNDWRNSQVLNLLSSKEQKGNCFAITSLFKILSDRLNSEAYICTAPQHIYIQHQDHKGDFYNVELATGTHPGDGSLQTLTYTYYEGIVSGISLRRLKQEKQTIALCLVNLGKSYEHKFKTRDDDFILECAELALKHDSLSLNAMLLKEQVLEERVIKYASQKNITDISKLKLEKGIASTYKKLEAQIIKLYDLGYHQMPLYMQEMILSALKREDNKPIIVQDRTPNPFPSLKNVAPEDKRYSTLSGGLFEEVHEKKPFEQYGRFTIDTDKKKIVEMLDSTNFQFLIDPVVFAWSVDPMAHKMPAWSPYSAFMDNPIFWDDPGGDCPICPWLDAIVDIGFAAYDAGEMAYDYMTTGQVNPVSAAALTADLGSIFIPMSTGAGLAVRAGFATTKAAVKTTTQVVIQRAKNIAIKSADDINKVFTKAGKYAPYKSGTKVAEFTTEASEQFVRVFKEGNNSATGKWMMKKSDLLGEGGKMLSPEQIQKKFSLEYTPDRMVDVNVPGNTNMRMGEAAGVDKLGTPGGGTQFELLQDVPNTSFGKPQAIEQ